MNELRDNILNSLKERPKTIYELVNELKKPRITIHDNSIVLQKLGKIEIFKFNNQCSGRPINFYRLLNNREISIIEIEKILIEIDKKKEKLNRKFIMNRDYNSMNKDLKYKRLIDIEPIKFNKRKKSKVYKNSKKKVIKKKIIKKRVIEIDICNNCKREISQTIPLVKLTDNNYYCYYCINRYPKIFNLINPNGLLYKTLTCEI